MSQIKELVKDFRSNGFTVFGHDFDAKNSTSRFLRSARGPILIVFGFFFFNSGMLMEKDKLEKQFGKNIPKDEQDPLTSLYLLFLNKFAR